jgi:hypothetical protein
LLLKNAKQKGNRQEHRTMAILEAAGYRCSRSGGSLGEWDVFAIGTVDVLLVQVKSNRGPRSLELMALKEFRVPPFVRRLIHVWRDGKRLPDVTEL